MIQHFPSVLLYFSFKIKVISLLHIHTAAIDSLSPPAVFVIQTGNVFNQITAWEITVFIRFNSAQYSFIHVAPNYSSRYLKGFIS